MPENNDQTKPVPAPLRVGLIADAENLASYADAIRATSAFELCAQAGGGQNPAVADVPWFDDTRVLIAQSGIDALVVAGAPRVGVRVGLVAAAHGIHVWRPPPLGRDFAEAVEVARQLANPGVVYRVASWWDHVGPDVRWALGYETGCQPRFSDIRHSAPGPSQQSWRSSRARAGGGVLAHDAYPQLEALVAIRGLPQSVVGATGKCRRGPTTALRETEDVANAIFRYAGGGIATVLATWDVPPFEQLSLHYDDQTGVRYDRGCVTALTSQGEVKAERSLPTNILAAELARFAAQIRDESAGRGVDKTLGRHLAVSALLEATYLSSRTEHPENPYRLYEVQKWPVPKR